MSQAVRRAWLLFSSLSVTAILGVLFSTLVAVTAFVPQGWSATELAKLEDTEHLRALYAWGLTDIAESPWMYGLAVLLAGNLVAVIVRLTMARRTTPDDGALAERAPHQSELSAPFPEKAVEGVRGALIGVFGRPVTERVEGPRVTLAFETAPRARLTPLMTHVGLILLVLGAVLSTRPAPRSQSMVRATLEVRDSRSPSVGRFDLGEGETRNFFQWRSEYVVRDYVADRLGLGPAVRMERIDPERRTSEDFWIYRDAPAGFDARHRAGQVSIVALDLGLAPKPGSGLASRPEAVLLLVGLGLLALGVRELGRPDGRLVIEAEGRRVKLSGVPHRTADPRFGSAFPRWKALAQWGLES